MSAERDYTEFSGLEIAVTGMSVRFPGAGNTRQFWQNLRNGVESIRHFTREELERNGISSLELNDPNYVKARGVLDDIELFDASLFDISPMEATILNPQHRLFLECVLEALEDSGNYSESTTGLIGVYGGASTNSYLTSIYLNAELRKMAGGIQLAIANDNDHLTTRVSYKLNLNGPSVNVQTACSTSLVAVHLACQGLLGGACDLAVAGGVSVSARQLAGYYYQEGGILSRNGQCRAFDAKADGCVGGNGIGIVVLKRLEDALKDRDTIHAIIKGSAVNNDGSKKIGYTAPSVDGQSAVIRDAQIAAGVEPETISYIEAHGTGTRLGDPIEIAALTQVFGKETTRRQYCAIGSVKSNIGHLDAAAGIAGLIKTIEALKHKEIPASLNYDEPNPEIDFERSPFYVNRELRRWEAKAGEKRRAGVSSFGIGGTNAHVVLEEAPEREASGQGRSYKIVMLSAKTETALERAANNLAEHLRETEEENLSDVAYTLQVGRKRMRHRQVVICHDREEAIRGLRENRNFREVERNASGVVYMFPGQGVQYVGMGRGLYESELEVREEIDRSAEYLKGIMGEDLREVLFPVEEKRAEAEEKLSRTEIAQPAIFILEKAVARLLMRYGIRPEAMIGHSLGEYTAACLSGVFSEEEGLRLVAARGRLMQQMKPGAMLAVGMNEEEIRKLIEARLDLAAVNTPSQCVVSGDEESIQSLETILRQRTIDFVRLQTSHAFHSSLMEPLLGAYRKELSSVKFKKPQIPYIANVTGQWVSENEILSADYWLKQLRDTVRFHEGIEELKAEKMSVFIEVGPGRALSRLSVPASNDQPGKIAVINTMRSRSETKTDDETLATALGKLWQEGVNLDWKEYYRYERRNRVALPTYPFERKRFWVEPPRSGLDSVLASASKKDSILDSANSAVGSSTSQIQISAHTESDKSFSNKQSSRAQNQNGIERLISKQLQIMSRQINIMHEIEKED